MVTNRGQGHALEAIVSALLILAAIGFALQMTAVTPLSASTSSQHIENQLKGISEGLLASAAEKGHLRRAVLYWNESRYQFHNATEDRFYSTFPPDNRFGAMLNRSFDQQRIAYNVFVHYKTAGGDTRQARMIYSGDPSDHAVSADHMLTLTDDDYLVERSGETDYNHSLQTVSNFYIPDADPGSGFYNLVQVEVVAWRI